MITQNEYYSYNSGELPLGCQYCVRGEKLVLFTTGLCPRRCYFCPISDQKYDKDVVYANERNVATFEDVALEAEAMDAQGAGVTGGDPLMRLDRTVLYIKKLKQKFGKDFHIHLYTSLNLVTESTLQRLAEAGLDEIRFHCDLVSDFFWEKIEKAVRFPWDVGIEIPLIPKKEKEIKRLIDTFHTKIKFVNLNELERSDNTMSELDEMEFSTKSKYSYAIKGSVETGLRIMNYVARKRYALSVHLCTAKLKDAIQLKRRIEREGKHMKKPFDVVDREGLLLRGALYLPELAPGFNYRKNLENVDTEEYVARLQQFLMEIKEKFGINDGDIEIDKRKPRILISAKNLRKYSRELLQYPLLQAIVKEYPTADQLEMEVHFLHQK